MTERHDISIYDISFEQIAKVLGFTASDLHALLIDPDEDLLMSLRVSDPKIADAIDAHLARSAIALIPTRHNIDIES